MKRNLHNIDRVLRIVIGLVCIYFGFIDTTYISQNIVAILVGVLGVVNLLAALFAFCPLYGITGISTYKVKSDSSNEEQT